MKLFTILLFALLFFAGCSSKQYYNPKGIKSFDLDKEIVTIPSYIKSLNSAGATTIDNRIINDFGVSSFSLQEGYEYVNTIDNTIISADKKGNIYISDTNSTINFSSNVIAATKKDNLLAMNFSDNSFGIWDLKENKFKIKEYLDPAYINDTRFAMPIILSKITLFPTLDGKIVIIDNESNKISRTLSIDLQNEVKNIILLKTVGDTLIAASGAKIVSLNKGKYNTKDVLIQNYTIDDNFIYLALLDGTLMKLDFDLNVINSTKFKFAKFHAIGLDSSKNIYLLESQGYILKLSNDFKTTLVDTLSFFEDEKVYASKNKIYFENQLLKLD